MAENWVLAGDRFRLDGVEGLSVFTTTRALGMPAGEFSSRELRETAEKAGLRPAAVAGMQQVHGCGLERVEEAGDRVASSCDALITDRPGVALAVRSADCLPVIGWNRARGILGVAHAGWRGVKAGVLSRWVREMGSTGLSVAIGPGIGSCCYEVGPEFEEWAPDFLRRKGKSRFFDLKEAAIRQIREAGVERIVCAPWCTCCTPECHSYRREREKARRMVTFALLGEP